MTTVPTCAARPSETTSRPGKLEGPGVSDDLGSPLRASMAVSARPFLDLRRKPPAMARRLPREPAPTVARLSLPPAQAASSSAISSMGLRNPSRLRGRSFEYVLHVIDRIGESFGSHR